MTQPSFQDTSYFVGIDVAKAKLDLARSDTGQILTTNNDSEGIGRIVDSLRSLAPYNRDSGTIKGQRSIFAGRASVRSVLYMATVTAIRFNPVIKAFAQRLDKLGKAKKVQIVACMRKLLGLLNAMIRDRLTWDQLSVVKALAI